MARKIVYMFFGLIALSLGLVQCAHTPQALSMDISPSSASLTSVGQTVQFEAFADFLTGHNSSTGNVTNQATWSSSSPSVATINSSGLAKAVSTGTTTITATLQSSNGNVVTATATLTVAAGAVPRDLASITIVPSSQNVSNKGETIQFQAIGNFSAPPTTEQLTSTTIPPVTWSSSDTTIATINSATGLATGMSLGTSTITATATAPVSGATIIGTASLTVSATAVATDLTSITIIPSSQTVTSVGETNQFIAIGNYSGGAPTQNLTAQATWQSSDVTVATIESTGQANPGLAAAVGGGTTTITAQSTAKSGSVITGVATLSVSANAVTRELTSITIIPSSQVVSAQGESAQFIAIGNFSGAPTTVDMTGAVTWASSDVQVATINSNGVPGLATSNHNDTGQTEITASCTWSSTAQPAGSCSPTNSGNIIVGTAEFINNGTGGGLVPTLTVTELGAGSGTVVSSATATTQAGLITCPATNPPANGCSASYPVGTTVTLTATATPGSTFGGWSANCTPVTANSCQLTMNGNEPVAAIFNLNQP